MAKAYQVTAYDDDGEILAWINCKTEQEAERVRNQYLAQGAPDASVQEVEEVAS